jgi:DNA-binding winged helix-turn-helix (wHTH) protein
MALCEHCRAELDSPAERLPPPWFDHDKREIAGRRVTPRQWAMLQILWRRRGRLVTKDSFLTLMYGVEADNPPFEKIVDVFVCKLRQRLASTPYSIETVWGHGYRLAERPHCVIQSLDGQSLDGQSLDGQSLDGAA